MARRRGGTRRLVDRPSPERDDASAWARFLRRLTEAEAQATDAQTEGAWARFLRRLAVVRERPEDTRSDDS